MDLAYFEHMWTSPPGRYALVRVEQDEEAVGLLPLGLAAKAVVLIDEDDPLADAVVQRMVEAGVPVLDREPW